MRKILTINLLVLASALLWAMPSPKTTGLVASWSANPGNAPGEITNYVVYWGTSSSNYVGSANAGTNLSAQVVGLAWNTTYYVAVTAQSTNGTESDYSTEVTCTMRKKASAPLNTAAAAQ